MCPYGLCVCAVKGLRGTPDTRGCRAKNDKFALSLFAAHAPFAEIPLKPIYENKPHSLARSAEGK